MKLIVVFIVFIIFQWWLINKLFVTVMQPDYDDDVGGKWLILLTIIDIPADNFDIIEMTMMLVFGSVFAFDDDSVGDVDVIIMMMMIIDIDIWWYWWYCCYSYCWWSLILFDKWWCLSSVSRYYSNVSSWYRHFFFIVCYVCCCCCFVAFCFVVTFCVLRWIPDRFGHSWYW